MKAVRELHFQKSVSVDDIYALVDLPYKITKKAEVTVSDSLSRPERETLRVEWEIEHSDPLI